MYPPYRIKPRNKQVAGWKNNAVAELLSVRRIDKCI